MSKMIDTVKVNFFINAGAEIRTGEEDPPYYSISQSEEMFGGGYIKVHTVEVQIERPIPQEIVPKQIAMLREQQQKIRAAAESNSRQIEETIGKLLAIGHDVGSEW